MQIQRRFSTIRRSTVFSGFVMLLTALVANTVITRLQLGIQARNQDRVLYSRQVLSELAQTESLLKDAEIVQFSLIYTDDPRYLAPYDEVISQFRPHLENLAQMTADNPRQKARVPLLRKLVDDKLHQIAQTVSLDESGKTQEAKALIVSNSALTTMQDIQGVVHDMEQDEISLQASRLAIYQRSTRITVACIYITNLIMFLGLIILALHTLREMKARELDAQELRDRQQKLVESQERFELFIEHAPAALAMFDDQMRYLYVSRRWLTDYGLGDRDLRGTSHYEAFPEISDEWKEMYRRGLAGEVTSRDADRFERSDGSVQWIRWEIRPWQDAERKIRGIVLFSEDITERRKAEELLRLSQERLRLAHDVAGMGTFDVELPSGKRTWSSRTVEIFGLAPDSPQTESEDLLRMVHPDDRSMVAQKFASLATGKRLQVEYRIIRADGELRWVEISGRGIFSNAGRPIRYLGVCYDITERKLAEDKLRRSEDQLRALTARLQTAIERERLRIAQELHDQLGQALTGIKMDLDWIVRKHGTGDEIWVSMVQDAMSVVDANIALVRRLSTELRPQLLDSLGLRAAIEWELEQFQRRSGVRCVVRVCKLSLGLSNERKIAIFRIFQEAMTNVARHAHAKNVFVEVERERDEVVLTIKDDGLGFSGDLTEHVQSLGLLGMRERALVMGAEYHLESVPGQGTTITLRVPEDESDIIASESHEDINR